MCTRVGFGVHGNDFWFLFLFLIGNLNSLINKKRN